jgi:hypothetical protein
VGTLATLATAPANDNHSTAEQMLMSGINCGKFDNNCYMGFQFIKNGTTNKTTSKNRRSVTKQPKPKSIRKDCRSVALNTTQASHIPKSWILLDNQSTVDVFHNDELLKNIREGDGHMDIHNNAGVTSTNIIGDLPGYGPVWYHPNGIANILSLSRVKQKCRVTFDSQDGNAFTVHSTRTFQQSNRGLYYMETKLTGTLLVHTVADNKSKYTNRDYSRAVLARQIQKNIGQPSTRAFIKIVQNYLLPNCPVTRDGIIAAERIFGPDVGSLQGKTRVEARTINIPATIMSR